MKEDREKNTVWYHLQAEFKEKKTKKIPWKQKRMVMLGAEGGNWGDVGQGAPTSNYKNYYTMHTYIKSLNLHTLNLYIYIC